MSKVTSKTFGARKNKDGECELFRKRKPKPKTKVKAKPPKIDEQRRKYFLFVNQLDKLRKKKEKGIKLKKSLLDALKKVKDKKNPTPAELKIVTEKIPELKATSPNKKQFLAFINRLEEAGIKPGNYSDKLKKQLAFIKDKFNPTPSELELITLPISDNIQTNKIIKSSELLNGFKRDEIEALVPVIETQTIEQIEQKVPEPEPEEEEFTPSELAELEAELEEGTPGVQPLGTSMAQIMASAEQLGTGKELFALYDSQIEEMMKDMPGFKGVISADEMKSLPVSPKMSFIMNKDTSDMPGSHWVAVWIDAKDEHEINYYDPLGFPPDEMFLTDIKNIIKKIKPKYYLKMKINIVKNQSDTTQSCGHHAMNFIRERSRGKRFKDVTGYKPPPPLKNWRQKERELKLKFKYL